jgi:hypothetical protein
MVLFKIYGYTIVEQGLEIGTAGKEKMDCILEEGLQASYTLLCPVSPLMC